MKDVLTVDQSLAFAWDGIVRPTGVCIETTFEHTNLSEQDRLTIIASTESDPISLALAHKQALYVSACDAPGELKENALALFCKGNSATAKTEQERLAAHMQMCEVSTAAQEKAKQLFEESCHV